jgi:hypothetical protein
LQYAIAFASSAIRSDHVDAWRRVAAGRQLVFPQHTARALLERSDLLVGGRGDESRHRPVLCGIVLKVTADS